MYNSPFKWWVQSVMPVVFDDSLSYYEVLAKLTKYIEGLTGDVQEIEKVLETIDGVEDIAEFTKFLETIQTEIGNLNNLQTDSKNNLVNAINEVVLKANIAYKKPPSGIPESDLDQSVRDKLNQSGETAEYIINNKTLKKAPNNNSPADLGLGTYSVPQGGIPWDTLSQDVRDRIESGGGGTGGTKDYNELNNKPQINGHTLNAGNNTIESLGLGTYSKPNTGIPERDLSTEVQEKLNTSGGIADSESDFVATRDYEAGELIYIDGTLYKTKYMILNGTNLIPGNNIEVTDISAEIENINSKIDSMGSGEGLDSWSLTYKIPETRQDEYRFFEYFNCIGGESYLFILTPYGDGYKRGYFNINKRDGTNVYRELFTSLNQSRFTFTPSDTGEYYCVAEPYRVDGESYFPRWNVTLEYTQSQGISELWTQVNKASQVEPRVGALETLVGEQQTRVDNLRSALSEVQSGILIEENAVTPVHADFINCAYQFIDNSTNVAGEIWNYTNGQTEPVPYQASNFARVLKFLLPPGDYSVPLTHIFASQSYVKDSNGVQKFKDKFSTESLFTGQFTLTENSEMYLSSSQSHNYILLFNLQSYITTYKESMKYRGVYYASFNGVKVNASDIVGGFEEDTSIYEQAFIKNGELTCNNDHLNANTSVAKYTEVDMGSNIVKVKCRAKFKTLSTNAAITLISTGLHTLFNVQDIVKKSIHVNFTGTTCYVETFDESVRTVHQTFTYTINANQEYDFGWSIAGDTLTVYLPDGTTQTVTNEAFSASNGRYLIFEHFSYQTAATDPVTDNFGQPVITGIYCTCANGLPLRDNFKRPSGLPLSAPTGHVYEQFRNAASGDTVYDNAGGSVN